ncbi:phage tail protein [Halomonas sp. BM-2019]|uniref:phage tail protein n=1 Tax=Halomonas sp. BM-2019 TaxID=2811227 RepID=UPI001B3C1B2B|nr:MAG: phage tail protein [Halomonas sp. BM-2019]
MSEFIPFRFRISLYNGDRSQLLCSGAFSEATGFELTMEPRAITEGGRNWGELQRSGPTRFAPLILKRGVTHVDDLWQWFDITTRQANYGYRLEGEILVLGNPGSTVAAGQHGVQSIEEQAVMRWELHGVLPTRFKGPDLSATASQVAIEELHLVHEGLELKRPAPDEGGA